jgi:hypothetical protein
MRDQYPYAPRFLTGPVVLVVARAAPEEHGGEDGRDVPLAMVAYGKGFQNCPEPAKAT